MKMLIESPISTEAQRFLQDCMCAQRSSEESLYVWLSAQSNNSDQPAHLIRVIAWRTCGLVGNAVARPICCHLNKSEVKVRLNCQIYVEVRDPLLPSGYSPGCKG